MIGCEFTGRPDKVTQSSRIAEVISEAADSNPGIACGGESGILSPRQLGIQTDDVQSAILPDRSLISLAASLLFRSPRFFRGSFSYWLRLAKVQPPYPVKTQL